MQIVNSNSLLQNATPKSVFNAACMAATLNLPINNSLGFAYIVPFQNRKENVTEAQFQLGYKGFIQLAQRSGQFKRINACPVYDTDTEEDVYQRLTSLIPRKPSGQIIGYIAYFQLLNGYEANLTMTMEELEAHAKRYSQTYKRGFGVWADNFEAMAKKTVIKLLLSQQAVNADGTNILYNGDTSQKDGYTEKGSLKEWQEQAARYAENNSRLCLALGLSMAAPFLALLNEEGGGFHLAGDSSKGKTTAARLALSVWGDPETTKGNWDTAKQRGTAGRALIRQILKDGKEAAAQAVEARCAKFLETLPPMEGQARRIARRFALLAAVLEYAAPITGMRQGAGEAGVKQCFIEWLEENGTGNREDRRIIEQVIAFMDVNALSMRFSDWNAQTTNQNHAGYRKQEGSIDEYWIIPVTFENEVCKGYSQRKVCEVLHDHEWLKKADNGRWQHQRKRNGVASRFYVLIGEAPPDFDE